MFWNKKPIIADLPKATDADKLVHELRQAYKMGERVKELHLPKDIYDDLFEMGGIDNVGRVGDNIQCSFEYYPDKRIRLIVKI